MRERVTLSCGVYDETPSSRLACFLTASLALKDRRGAVCNVLPPVSPHTHTGLR